jgi:hypothetical protein
MKNAIPILIVLLLGCFFVYLYTTDKILADTGSKIPDNARLNNIYDSLFKTGDLIFRDGRGVISSAFRMFSLKSPLYSHAGIVHREKGKIYVYHIIGGESNSPGKMKKEPLTRFIDPLQANAFAVYRFNISPVLIDSLATDYYSKNIEFDKKFDLKSNDKMYCTELVYRILQQASGDKNFIPLTEISGVQYVACDNIYLSSNSKQIYSYSYNN